ncbi:MAG TPA: phosphotransferase [Solirubrobacteraceae bacterium]|nr:phosphotransferase [Solirubrobacteraceae bacterium]
MQLLEPHEVADYLLARRLLSRRSIVSGHLRITDASSRNRNLRVSGGPGESYLLKQGIAADSGQTLDNEVALYRRLSPGGAPVPRLVAHDDARGIVIIEWIAGGEDLVRLHARRDRCPTGAAAALGRALAAIHAVKPDDEELRDDPPWVLSLHRPQLDALRHLSAASVDLVKRLQHDAACCRALDELREGFVVEALVHRDVKWENCIADGARRDRVKLVDWEMAGWGDPAHDVGSAFSDYVAHRPELAPQPAIARLWSAYVRARRLAGPQASQLLERSARYAGARLLQSAFEHTQEARAAGERVETSLRAGHELLVRPGDAAVALLGVAP